jgi:rhomboid protease GluP
MHIVFNVYALRGLGALLERFFGGWRFLWVYFISLLGASILVTLFSPLYTMTLGASGAIMGLLGALVVYYWKYRDLLVGGRNYLNELLRMAAINVFIGLLPGISLWGHAGGLLAGALVGWVLCPRYEYVDFPPALKQRALEPGKRLGLVLIVVCWVALLAFTVMWRN